MRFRVDLLIAILALSLSARTGSLSLSAQQPAPRPGSEQAFRSSTELVAVRTVVTRDGQPVRGLTAKDFAVRDGGDLRPVEVADAGTVPVDLALVVDQGGHSALYNDSFARDLADIPPLLRPGDRFSVTVLGDAMVEIVSLDGSAAQRSALRPGQSPNLDAITRALIAPVPAGRQRSVIFVGLSGDGGSVMDYEAVLRLARATPARLYVAFGNWKIWNGGLAGSRIFQRGFEAGAMHWDYDERRTATIWTQSRDPDNISARGGRRRSSLVRGARRSDRRAGASPARRFPAQRGRRRAERKPRGLHDLLSAVARKRAWVARDRGAGARPEGVTHQRQGRIREVVHWCGHPCSSLWLPSPSLSAGRLLSRQPTLSRDPRVSRPRSIGTRPGTSRTRLPS
jgi:hypothetical protein